MKQSTILIFAVALALAGALLALPVRADTYTITLTSNITATLGCYQNVSIPWCTEECSDCRETVCVSDLSGSMIGVCATVYTDVLNFEVTGMLPHIYKGTWQDGATRWMIGALDQTIVPTGTYAMAFEIETPFESGGSGTESVVPLDWTFPTEPLRPFTWSRPVSRDIFNPRITPQNLWDAARTALTAYTIVSGNNSDTWMVYAIVLLLPFAGLIVYRLLTKPPDI